MIKNDAKQNSFVYEVVTGEILLSSRKEFFRLHESILLPIMEELGIKPTLLLMTEVGRYGRFVDIYKYKSYNDYFKLTTKILEHPSIESYYNKIGKCINGTINIELMKELPYFKNWM